MLWRYFCRNGFNIHSQLTLSKGESGVGLIQSDEGPKSKNGDFLEKKFSLKTVASCLSFQPAGPMSFKLAKHHNHKNQLKKIDPCICSVCIHMCMYICTYPTPWFGLSGEFWFDTVSVSLPYIRQFQSLYVSWFESEFSVTSFDDI